MGIPLDQPPASPVSRAMPPLLAESIAGHADAVRLHALTSPPIEMSHTTNRSVGLVASTWKTPPCVEHAS